MSCRSPSVLAAWVSRALTHPVGMHFRTLRRVFLFALIAMHGGYLLDYEERSSLPSERSPSASPPSVPSSSSLPVASLTSSTSSTSSTKKNRKEAENLTLALQRELDLSSLAGSHIQCSEEMWDIVLIIAKMTDNQSHEFSRTFSRVGPQFQITKCFSPEEDEVNQPAEENATLIKEEKNDGKVSEQRSFGVEIKDEDRRNRNVNTRSVMSDNGIIDKNCADKSKYFEPAFFRHLETCKVRAARGEERVGEEAEENKSENNVKNVHGEYEYNGSQSATSGNNGEGSDTEVEVEANMEIIIQQYLKDVLDLSAECVTEGTVLEAPYTPYTPLSSSTGSSPPTLPPATNVTGNGTSCGIELGSILEKLRPERPERPERGERGDRGERILLRGRQGRARTMRLCTVLRVLDVSQPASTCTMREGAGLSAIPESEAHVGPRGLLDRASPISASSSTPVCATTVAPLTSLITDPATLAVCPSVSMIKEGALSPSPSASSDLEDSPGVIDLTGDSQDTNVTNTDETAGRERDDDGGDSSESRAVSGSEDEEKEPVRPVLPGLPVLTVRWVEVADGNTGSRAVSTVPLSSCKLFLIGTEKALQTLHTAGYCPARALQMLREEYCPSSDAMQRNATQGTREPEKIREWVPMDVEECGQSSGKRFSSCDVGGEDDGENGGDLRGELGLWSRREMELFVRGKKR